MVINRLQLGSMVKRDSYKAENLSFSSGPKPKLHLPKEEGKK
jgi:hypothetical protein